MNVYKGVTCIALLEALHGSTGFADRSELRPRDAALAMLQEFRLKTLEVRQPQPRMNDLGSVTSEEPRRWKKLAERIAGLNWQYQNATPEDEARMTGRIYRGKENIIKFMDSWFQNVVSASAGLPDTPIRLEGMSFGDWLTTNVGRTFRRSVYLPAGALMCLGTLCTEVALWTRGTTTGYNALMAPIYSYFGIVHPLYQAYWSLKGEKWDRDFQKNMKQIDRFLNSESDESGQSWVYLTYNKTLMDRTPTEEALGDGLVGAFEGPQNDMSAATPATTLQEQARKQRQFDRAGPIGHGISNKEFAQFDLLFTHDAETNELVLVVWKRASDRRPNPPRNRRRREVEEKEAQAIAEPGMVGVYADP